LEAILIRRQYSPSRLTLAVGVPLEKRRRGVECALVASPQAVVGHKEARLLSRSLEARVEEGDVMLYGLMYL
jgi:hypothetical protein